MDKKMNFKYFYGTEADQFSFYRIPKALFTNDCFKDLSSDAKILYGLMLDRSAEGKRVERKPAQRSEQSSKKKPKKRESVIKRLREKQIAIAVKSGKPVPRYLEQDMERRRG